MKCGAAAAIAILVGCSGPHSSDGEDEVVLRVSAAAGLSDLTPGLEVSGSSAAAMDLVFEEVRQHVESLEANGSTVTLIRRRSNRLSADELSAALRGKELLSARAVDDQRLEARFRDATTAQLVAQYEALGFDIGPFRVEARDDKRMRLVRRVEAPIDAIELVAASRSDEWRKLLAHELDVVPLAANVYRAQFSGVESVRVLDIPPQDTAALYFNVRFGELADAAVRRRIASGIRRVAVARLACGDPACASVDPDGAADIALPRRLAVLVPDDFTTFLTAAKVLRHQLWPLGTELDIQRAPVNEIVQRMTSGNYELVILPLTLGDHRFGFFLSPGHPKGLPMTGFADKEYDAAVDRGDLVAAQAILDEQVPVTRIFESRSFAAVDSQFCGDVTPSASSWLWLSELYPCEEGREQ